MEAALLVRVHGKHSVLEPTKEANDVADQNKSHHGRLRVAKEPDVVEKEARKRLLTAGGCLSEQGLLNFTELQFG